MFSEVCALLFRVVCGGLWLFLVWYGCLVLFWLFRVLSGWFLIVLGYPWLLLLFMVVSGRCWCSDGLLGINECVLL